MVTGNDSPPVVDLSVVIPVYNEEESLSPLWAELQPVLEALGVRWEVSSSMMAVRTGAPTLSGISARRMPG